VFDCNSNATTGLLPAQAQEAFYRMSRDSNPGTIRITGYGVDGPSPCWGDADQPGCTDPNPPQDADSWTLQTHAGPSNGETTDGTSDVYWDYRVDTQGGNSGSPIIIDGTDLTVGIHTAGGCTATGGANHGTSFENNDLENAIHAFPELYSGQQIIYVDRGFFTHAQEDGTVFSPFDTVGEAVNTVLSGGIISIVEGEYNEALTLGDDGREMILEAPVGRVTIGPSTL